MSVVVYGCDTCNREIELQQNPIGLESFGKCLITMGCRGKMFKKYERQDFIRAKIPDADPDLDDFIPRNALYEHKQNVPMKTWYVRHGLGVAPSMEVFETRFDENNADVITAVEPKVTVEGDNVIRLDFERETRGIAQAIARSTKEIPSKVRSRTARAVVSTVQQPTESATIRVTGKQETVTVGTLARTDNVDIEVVYTFPDLTERTIKYTASSVPSIVSPWSGTTQVYVDGLTYVVRTFNLVNEQVTLSGGIPTGSTFYIKSVNRFDIKPKEVIALLATDPFEIQDRIQDKYIDMSVITADNAASSGYVSVNQLYCYTSTLISVYPPIQQIT